MGGFLKTFLLILIGWRAGAAVQSSGDSSLILPSFVVHGLEPRAGAATSMPRKITGNGDAVATPGLGVEFVNDAGVLFLGAMVKDCYDNLAGTFQIGKDFRISRDAHWALSAGLYIRETPLDCSRPGSFVNGCFMLDTMSQSFAHKVNGAWVDIIPMPFFHYTQTLYRDKSFQIRGKIIANFFLNEVGLEFPF